MTDEAECCECGTVSVSVDGTWKRGEVCLFGTLFACSMRCAEAFATKHARVGCRPGEAGLAKEAT